VGRSGLRVLKGTSITESGPAWRGALARAARLVVDVGAGDGRWVYEQARADPSSLYVALDPDAEALAEYAFRASRKAARGGVVNALFVAAAVEEPPTELAGLADEVHVNFPWAALLRGLLLPDARVLAGIVALAKPGALLEMVLTYDAAHDHGAGLAPGVPSLAPGLLSALAEPYAAAGVELAAPRLLSREEALAVPSTWGRRLLHGRRRDVYLVRGAIRHS
jgi:16S rRNA (adenine(1408)-N(1))-methyltransferase